MEQKRIMIKKRKKMKTKIRTKYLKMEVFIHKYRHQQFKWIFIYK